MCRSYGNYGEGPIKTCGVALVPVPDPAAAAATIVGTFVNLPDFSLELGILNPCNLRIAASPDGTPGRFHVFLGHVNTSDGAASFFSLESAEGSAKEKPEEPVGIRNKRVICLKPLEQDMD